MEPTTIAFVDQYLEAGGAPFNIMNLLTTSYQGLAAMSNMVERDILHDSRSNESSPAIEAISRKIIERFDARAADAEFEKSQKLPDYIEEMIPYKAWRKTVYRLSDQNPKSTMLSAALQRIADEGYQAEMTSLSSASLHTHVFYSLLVECFEKLAPATDESIKERMTELINTACRSEHTYFMALYILSQVRQRLGIGAESVRRIEQELEMFMLEKYDRPQLAVNFRLLIDGFTVGSDDRIANSLAAIYQSAYASTGDVTTLYKGYHGALNSGRRLPPLDVIRNERILNPIFEESFGHIWGNSVLDRSPEITNRYMWLIACATQCTSEDPKDIDRSQLDNLVVQMKELDSNLPRRPILTTFNSAIGKVLEWINVPVLARVVLLWLRDYLSYDNFTFYSTYFQRSEIPTPLLLLEEIGYRHPLLKPLVFETYKDSFESKVPEFTPEKQINLQKMVINRIATLIQLNYALPVIHYFLNKAELTDESIVAYFIYRSLNQLEGPYPEEFYSPMLVLIKHAIDAISTANGKERSVIRTFLEEVDDDRARSLLRMLPQDSEQL
ncbi:hypothetical protein J3B02_004315 [Coemansia erecta]|nr:hypothetical protein J3B02_004315 [Coemansia erecta]